MGWQFISIVHSTISITFDESIINLDLFHLIPNIKCKKMNAEFIRRFPSHSCYIIYLDFDHCIIPVKIQLELPPPQKHTFFNSSKKFKK